MNKQEFIDKYGEYFDSRFIADLTLVIIDEKKKAIAEHEQDTKRLDKLQSLTKGYGNGWILRESENRGMRLHETSVNDALPNVRHAIDAYQPTKKEDSIEEDIKNALKEVNSNPEKYGIYNQTKYKPEEGGEG